MKLRNLTTLQWALGVSLVVHAVLLTVRFVDPERFNRVFEDKPLEVILVNAKSNEKPDKATAIAQTSLAGGGDADKGRATSPLPPSMLTDVGDSLEEESARKLETLQEQQNLLLAQVKSQLAAMPPPDPNQGQQVRAGRPRRKAPPADQAAGRDRAAHQHGKRAAQEALHQPGRARRGVRRVLRRPAPCH